jgi:hypothetical protein
VKKNKTRKRVWIMKSLLNNLRAAVVALSSISFMAPSVVLAKSPAAGHVTSQSRISSSMSSTSTTIRSSNGLSSDKISNLSVNSNISGNSQPGGHPHNSPAANSTIGSGVSKVSGLTSPWDSKVIPTGGSVKGVASVRSTQVMDLSDLGSDFKDLAKGTGEVIDDLLGIDHSPYKGKDDGGSAPSTAPSKPSAPGNSSMASIANNNAKYYDRNAYIKTNNKNRVSKEIEKKYNDSHPIAQKNKVTGGGDNSNSQSGGSNGNGGGGDNGGSTGTTSGGSTSNKPHKCCPMPFPFPFPTGCDNDGGYAGGDVSPAIYNSDDPAPAPVTTASATAPLADTGIDLVLEDVKLAAPATLVAGPAYTVTFRNQGTADAGKFQVAIAAGFNQQLKGNDPRAMVEVPSLAAGEVKEVTLRLPHKAMLVEDNGGGLVPFRYLAVMIDATSAVAETDKTNNAAVVESAGLESQDAAN